MRECFAPINYIMSWQKKEPTTFDNIIERDKINAA